MKPITFVEPRSVGGVLDALAKGVGDTRLIAGGSDLLAQLKDGSASYATLVSLGGLDGLRRIESTPRGLEIGAIVTIAQLERAQQLIGPYSILAEAARGVATPEIRNQGTLGGNLCQRPRCLYYRHALTPCLKKGGDGCPAIDSPYQDQLSIMGGHGCYAVSASDLGPPLIALGATAVIAGAAGHREVAVESFFTGPDRGVTRENVLGPSDLLTAVILPPMPANWRGLYLKGRERTAGDFPIVSLAIGYELVDGRIDNARLILGGVAPTPLRSTVAESILNGHAPSDALAAQAADAALANAQALPNNAHKLDLARALISRGIMRLANA